MKKLHILIPSLVATASMPLIGLVGCNKEPEEANVIKVNKWDYRNNCLSSDIVQIEENVQYKVKIVLSKFKNTIPQPSLLTALGSSAIDILNIQWILNGNDVTSKVSGGFGSWSIDISLKKKDTFYCTFMIDSHLTTDFQFSKDYDI